MIIKLFKLILSFIIISLITFLISFLLISIGDLIYLIFVPIILLFCFSIGWGIWKDNHSEEDKAYFFKTRVIIVSILLWPFVFFIESLKNIIKK